MSRALVLSCFYILICGLASDLGDLAYETLQTADPYGLYTTYSDVRDSFFPPKAIMQTPAKSHTEFLAHYKNTITSAVDHVDITSLDHPDGDWAEMFKSAIAELNDKVKARGGSPVTVRLIFGNVIGSDEDPSKIMNSILVGGSCPSHVEVHVGAYRLGLDSWVHSKIVAVDGKRMVFGGINFYSKDYLDPKYEDTFDISMEIWGSNARTGHGHAAALWTAVKRVFGTGHASMTMCHAGHKPQTWTQYSFSSFPEPKNYEPATWPIGQGHIRTITAARLGQVDSRDKGERNPSDAAFAKLFSAARVSIKISSQDFGPVQVPVLGYGWPWETIDGLLVAMNKGVEVYVVFSQPGSGKFFAYSNGWSATDVIQKIRERLFIVRQSLRLSNLNDDVLCQLLHVTYIRNAKQELQWESKYNIGNHGKVFIIDDRIFYVGSQNLYLCNLAEFGVIVDDENETQQLLQEWWRPLWNDSNVDAISGAGSQCCWRDVVPPANSPASGHVCCKTQPEREFVSILSQSAYPSIPVMVAGLLCFLLLCALLCVCCCRGVRFIRRKCAGSSETHEPLLQIDHHVH